MLKPIPPLKSVEEERADCIAAFEGVEIGALVEYCHHDLPVEHLTQPAINRIDFTCKHKAEKEQAKRLRYFRPHRETLPLRIEHAHQAWQHAHQAWQQEYQAWQQACQAWQQAIYENFSALADAHNRLHPESPWTGISLFPNQARQAK